jgi:ribosomal protein S18 acetylase RimI-like enzyme
MSAIDSNTVKIRRLTRNDVDMVISREWAEIPEKQMVYSQRGGPLDASFLAEYEGHLVGFVLGRLLYVGRPMIGVCQLNLIAVRPDYQHQGIASMLLDKLQSHCQEQGIQTIRALVHQDNTGLKNYLNKAGFNPSGFINYDMPC